MRRASWALGLMVVGPVLAYEPAPAESKAAAARAPRRDAVYALRLQGGTFHGPGTLPDSSCPTGLLSHIQFRTPLTGETAFFNNGAAPPNVPGDQEIDNVVDGRLSDGSPFNEHVWGGIAEVGGGAIRLMTVVTGNGPNQGREIYRLDPDFHLEITVDLAMDPGFPEGIIVRENLRISTGVLRVPLSLQTAQGVPGGQDRAGSLPSKVPILGRLGDFDQDGFLDGTIAGAANVPLGHMFSPGAPVLLERRFVSDIPASPLDAALLTVASASSHAEVWKTFLENHGQDTPLARYLDAHLPEYLAQQAAAWESAGKLLAAVRPDERQAATVAAARESVKAQQAALAMVREWCKSAVPSGAVPAEVSARAQSIFASASQLATQLSPHTQFRDTRRTALRQD
jgi:hypothetical protein